MPARFHYNFSLQSRLILGLMDYFTIHNLAFWSVWMDRTLIIPADPLPCRHPLPSLYSSSPSSSVPSPLPPPSLAFVPARPLKSIEKIQSLQITWDSRIAAERAERQKEGRRKRRGKSREMWKAKMGNCSCVDGKIQNTTKLEKFNWIL